MYCGALADLSRPNLIFDRVSIITRTYGGADGLRRLALLRQAAACVAQQTWPNLEWVVTEDGAPSVCIESPSPETPTSRFLANFALQHPKLKVTYVPSSQGGRSVAGNRGLEAATGDWIGFLDDDDLLYADHVETLMRALIESHTETLRPAESLARSVVAAYARAFDLPSKLRQNCEANGTVFDQAAPLRGDWASLAIEEEEPYMHPGHDRSFDPAMLLEFNYMPIQAVLFNRELVKIRGGFDPELEQLEDWNLWLRYAADHWFLYVPKTTSIYRTPSDPEEKVRRQTLLDKAYMPVREKNHVFYERLRLGATSKE